MIFQGLTNQQGRLPVSTTAAITHGFRGLNFAGDAVAVVLDSAQERSYSQALAFAGGRLIVDTVGAIASHSSGMPLTAAGALAVENDGVVNHHAQGVPFTSGGRVVVAGLVVRAPRSLRTEDDRDIRTEAGDPIREEGTP